MGNTSSCTNPEQKYAFFAQYQDPKLGPTNIYQLKGSPNTFMVSQTQVLERQSVSTIQRNLKTFMIDQMSQEIESPFLRIFDFSIQGNDQPATKIVSSCQLPSVTFWVEFLRHSLKHFLHWRKTQKRPLTISQFKMALSKAIKAYESTKCNEVFGPSLNLEDISVNIEGQMKFDPFIGKKFFEKTSLSQQKKGQKNCRKALLTEKIISKRTFQQEKQNVPPKMTGSCGYKYFSPYLAKDNNFLVKLKIFAQEIAKESGCQIGEVKNPEDSQFVDENQVKTFLAKFEEFGSLNQAKNFLGEVKMIHFHVDLARLKHEEFEAKFSKILWQLEQKSEKTDTSLHEHFSYQPPVKKLSSKDFQQ